MLFSPSLYIINLYQTQSFMGHIEPNMQYMTWSFDNTIKMQKSTVYNYLIIETGPDINTYKWYVRYYTITIISALDIMYFIVGIVYCLVYDST